LAGLNVWPLAAWGNPYDPAVLGYWRIGVWITAAALLLTLGARPEWLFSALESSGHRLLRPRPAVFALAVGVVTTALALWVSASVLHGAASTSDEVAQLWHARILLHGRLALPPDPNPEFFAVDNVIDAGKWYSHFPIGGPLALVPGVLFGLPQLAGPVLAGASAAVLYQFARHAWGEFYARMLALLFATSPMVLFMSATYMNHVPTLFLALGALATAGQWERSASTRTRIVAATCVGLCMGGIATIRPLDAVVVAVTNACAQVGFVARHRTRVPELAVEAVAAGLATTVLLYANWRTNGNPLVFGYDLMWGTGHRVGFHAGPNGQIHTIQKGFDYAVTYVGELNYMLLAWPVPIMVLMVAGIACLRPKSRWDATMLVLFFGQLVAYAAYWGVGELFGPRFLYTAIPAMLAFVLRVPFAIGQRLGHRAALATALVFATWVAAAWGVTGLAGNALGLARQARGQRAGFKYDAAAVVQQGRVHHALVFVREPASERLLRRMWGLGVTRSDAVAILAAHDACSLLAAVAVAERDTTPRTPADAARGLTRLAVVLPPTGAVRLATNSQMRFSSPASVTAACRDHLDPPGFVPLSFGAALPLEPIAPDGRVDGDVVYVADLDEHNAVLRARFGNRPWYRLVAGPGAPGRVEVHLAAYGDAK
jgi:hypothetical protein